MKKLFVCVVSVVMLAVLTACGNEVREDREQPARAENIAMSADMETDTGHDVQERGSDSIEAESEENAGRTLDDTAADSRSGEDGTVDTAADSRSGEDGTVDTTADSGSEDINEEAGHMDNTMKITARDTTFTAAFADNSSAEALKELLAEGPLTINMSDYASMEKVGPIGTNLPRNDEQITTGAGDIILYQGNSLVIYYDTNSWNFTRIGKINDVTQAELLEAFGDGDVTVTFSLD
jgi:hypothetical protein